MERIVAVSCEGRWLEFLTRIEPGYDHTVTDKIVVKENFHSNVYQVEKGDLADTGIVVDVGGNIGAFSIRCAALGAKELHIFEPETDCYGYLKENLKRNGFAKIAKVHKWAIAGRAGTATLIRGQGASYVEGVKNLTPAAEKMVSQAPREEVQTKPLKEALHESGVAYCDILKMDCEGSEYGIIAAADSDTMKKCKYIVMEFHITSAGTLGLMLAKLSQTHNVHVIGSYTTGGQLYARRY